MSDLPDIPKRTPVRVFWTFVVFLLAFLIFGGAIWFLVQSYNNVPTVEDERARIRLHDKMKLEAEAKRQMLTYGWVDEGTGRLHVPTERAMELVLADLQAKRVTASEVPVPGTKAAEEAAAALMQGASPAAGGQGDAGAEAGGQAASAPAEPSPNSGNGNGEAAGAPAAEGGTEDAGGGTDAGGADRPMEPDATENAAESGADESVLAADGEKKDGDTAATGETSGSQEGNP